MTVSPIVVSSSSSSGSSCPEIGADVASGWATMSLSFPVTGAGTVNNSPSVIDDVDLNCDCCLCYFRYNISVDVGVVSSGVTATGLLTVFIDETLTTVSLSLLACSSPSTVSLSSSLHTTAPEVNPGV